MRHLRSLALVIVALSTVLATCGEDDAPLGCRSGDLGCPCFQGTCHASRVCDLGADLCREALSCADAGCAAQQQCEERPVGDAVCLDAWRQDLDRILEAVREQTGASEVVFVGLRLGGSLALERAQQKGGVRALVLWDPIVDGGAYHGELEVDQRKHLARQRIEPDPEGARPTEVAGFPLPSRFKVVAGRSPDTMASPRPSIPSDMTPMVTPAPVTPYVPRTASNPSSASPSVS